MPWPDQQFNLSDLKVGDEIHATGDDFDAWLTVIREGATPGCSMIEPDQGPKIVQIIGHGIYCHDITDHSTFVTVGTVGGGGQIMLAVYDKDYPQLRGNSLCSWKVWRDGEIIYNRGEVPDDDGDPDVPKET